MQSRNADIVREMLDALNRGDVDGVLAHMDRDFEWTPLEQSPAMGSHRGHERVRHYMEDWLGTFDMLRIEIEEIQEHDDLVVAVVVSHGRGKRSGVQLHNRFCQVWTLRDGMATSMEEHTTREAGLAAIR